MFRAPEGYNVSAAQREVEAYLVEAYEAQPRDPFAE
jgi:hypothetical protein